MALCRKAWRRFDSGPRTSRPQQVVQGFADLEVRGPSYQPLPAIFSTSGIVAMSRPTIASPRPSLICASALGSS